MYMTKTEASVVRAAVTFVRDGDDVAGDARHAAALERLRRAVARLKKESVLPAKGAPTRWKE